MLQHSTITALLLLTTQTWLVSCKPQMTPRSRSDSETAAGLGGRQFGSEDRVEDGDEANSGKKNRKAADESSEADDEGSDGELVKAKTSGREPEVYPKLAFKGSGDTSHELKDRLAMTQSISTDLDRRRLVLTTTEAHVSCSGVNGCKQDEVDQDVQAKMIGSNTYNRVSKNDLEDLIKGGFQRGPFAIFADAAVARNGMKFTFEDALPVFFWPAAARRFEDLDDGPLTWTSKVTTDRFFSTNPNLAQSIVDSGNQAFIDNGQIRKDFTVTITVTKVSQSGKTIVVRSDVSIPEDDQAPDKRWQGKIYEIFPVPKTATYTIDTKDQVITKIALQGWSNGDKSKQREETNLSFSICSKTTGDNTKNYACP